MRFILASLLMIATASAANAASQQQCEALMKPMEAKVATLPKLKDEEKPSPQTCARGREVIKMYDDYVAKADKMNCPFMYISGKPHGGKEERAQMMSAIKEKFDEKCR